MQANTWHSFDAEVALHHLESSTEGLTTADAQHRLAKYGPNTIPEKRRRSLLMILLGQFGDFMIMVLLAAALISGIIGEPQDTIAILVIVLLNAIIGAIQEFRAESAVAALREMATPEAVVLRDGKSITLAASELVPGDIVLLQAGNVVPADLRLLEVVEMQIDESALTGESIPVSKQSEVINKAELSPGARLNIAFKDSLITSGTGKGAVVATGLDSEIGRIAELLHHAADVKTPLQVRLTRFGRYLALAVLAICAVVFTAGLLQGQPLMLMLLTAVSLGVAAIPEALPAVVTISLALGARKLTRHNALVRNLPAVETLGSVTYICTDKTGTLTQNSMTAEQFFFASERHESLPRPEANAPWTELGQAIALNNDIVEKDGRPAGEPTELALFEAAHKAGFEKTALLETKPQLASIPFDSKRKLMTTLHQSSEAVVAYIKGAPEGILALCNNAYEQGETGAFGSEAVLAEASRLANEGYRVLAFAQRKFTSLPAQLDTETIEQDLSFLGLVALIDPPRAEVPQAVADCLTAGITQDDDAMLSGEELAKLSDEKFARVVESIRVYARVTPQQKLRIVKALQVNGEFVAMTVDGVNDAPALKRAGIGVAMG